jgi:hypothetical protein
LVPLRRALWISDRLRLYYAVLSDLPIIALRIPPAIKLELVFPLSESFLGKYDEAIQMPVRKNLLFKEIDMLNGNHGLLKGNTHEFTILKVETPLPYVSPAWLSAAILLGRWDINRNYFWIFYRHYQ